ncbi:MAG: hypothetical protein KGL39_27240 [Patescibacteria group bacterium]|nr:hypothetical protein [Patescibacteria group bacterium]
MQVSEMTPRGQRLYKRCLQLGYKDIAEQPHCEMLDFTATQFGYVIAKRPTQKKAALMVPRNCFKTSCDTVAGTVDMLAEDPNLTFLWATHTHDYTKQILSEAKWHFERNEDLREEMGLSGDPRKWGTKWAEDAITLPTRSRVAKEPTIDTCGLDNPKVGGHYDVCIVDDIHTRENITPRMLRKARHFIADLLPVLQPWGLVFVIGTRWHIEDVYAWIYEQNEGYEKRNQPSKKWDIMRRGCFDGPNGLYFPSRLTMEFIDEQRTALDDKTFAAQYLNEAISSEQQLFPSSLLKTFEGELRTPENEVPYLEMTVGANIPDRYAQLVRGS